MGSRRGWYAALVFAASCTAGAPPGFSSGESWTIPLIGPLEDGLLLVPGTVNGQGPYVFMIDPDAKVSAIDKQVKDEANAITGQGDGYRLLDENDKQQPRFYAEVLEWQLGTLTVAGSRPAQLLPEHTFDAGGRRIHGVIGRDIIADSLVFSFDRDAGLVTLSTHKAFKVPTNATTIDYSNLNSRVQGVDVPPISRRITTAVISGQRFVVHLDFGATASQLRSRSWPKANLAESELQLLLVDEVGVPHEIKKQGTAASVSLANLTTKSVPFVPYNDKRWPDQDLEGALGLSFFKPYSVSVNWDKSKVYVTPRKPTGTTVALRIGRWQSKTFSGCANVGCVKVTVIDPLAGKPPDQMPATHPGLVASITRDPAAKQLSQEVLIAVTPAAGKPLLKWLVVNLPAGTDRAMTHLSADYIGASFTVLDVSPFPRACPAEGGCVDLFDPPQQLAPPAPNEPQNVLPNAVKLRQGEKPIVPPSVQTFFFSQK